MKINDLMTKHVVTVTPATPLKEVARTLVERSISGVPVVADGGRVLGVVSEGDIIQKERGPGGERRRFLGRRDPGDAKRQARTAEEAMTSPAITISAFAPVAEAANLMADHGVDRLVVTEYSMREASHEGNLVGIVTRGDLVRAFARDDGEVAREIRTLMEREFGLLPGQVRAEVHEGEVTLDGEVDLETTAESLEAMVARVPGVLALDSKLTWRMKEASAREVREGAGF